VERGAWLEPGAVALRTEGERTLRLPLPAVPLPHPENLLAALLAAVALGADPAKALGALLTFRALPHRGERVECPGPVTWINDSKATNPHAACAALATVDAPILWIAGGREKGLRYDALADRAEGRVRVALLVGEAAPALAEALAGRVPCETVGTLEAAVRRAHALAEPGDVVLLSPACASFDQFRNFEERGDRFRAAVHALPRETPR
jgi:UDP-N-acetylmuramoylalanine--D-glutamate ligase